MAVWRRNLIRAGAVAIATTVLCWPAFWVGYPLLSPDSVDYLQDGRRVVLGLRGGHSVVAYDHYRSALYSLALYALRGQRTPWPVIAWSALLTAWTLWLTVRSVRGKRPVLVFLGLIVALSALTSVSWFVSIVLADILGAVLYLGLYLLVFAPETLRRWEAVAVAVLACWCVTTHLTHVMVAFALCMFLAAMWALRWWPLRARGPHLLRVSALVLFAMLVMVAVNARLFGAAKLSVTGPQPPHLMARILADGLAADYLRARCPAIGWTLCQDLDRLPRSPDEFLWEHGGIYASATPERKEALKREEVPLAFNTLRMHPKRQLLRSWSNFTAQLTDAGIQDVGFDTPWMTAHVSNAIPNATGRYLASTRREQAMPLGVLHGLQETVTVLASMVVAVMLPVLWCKRQSDAAARLLGLAAMVIFVLLSNAAVTGVLSGVYPRYQGRVEWLLPMLAVLLVYGRSAAFGERSARPTHGVN